MTKRTIISFLLMVAGVVGLGFIAPWWSGAVWVAVVATVARLNERKGILAGAFAIGIVWVGMAGYMSLQDDADIISKTGALLGGLSHQQMVMVTFLIGMITGIFSGWLGSALGHFIHPKIKEEN